MKSTESTPWRSPLRAQSQLETNGHDPVSKSDAEIKEQLKHEGQSVIPKKKTRADIRRFELVLVEIGLVLSLGLLLGIMKMPLRFE